MRRLTTTLLAVALAAFSQSGLAQDTHAPANAAVPGAPVPAAAEPEIAPQWLTLGSADAVTIKIDFSITYSFLM